MSWSDNRDRDSGVPLSVRKENLRQVNLMLQKLANDEDLHDDLLQADVKRAMQHWTGIKRLPPDEAVKLQENRRVVYVLQRLQIFQSVFKQAGIPQVPLELFIQRATQVPDDLVKKLFGADILADDTPKPNAAARPVAVKAAKPNNAASSSPPSSSSSVTETTKQMEGSEATGATEEDLRIAKETTDRAREAAEIEYSVEREKLEAMMKETPTPESDAGVLSLLTIVVTLLAVIMYFYMSKGSVESSEERL